MVIIAQSHDLFDFFSVGVDIPAIMKGVFAVEDFPEYGPFETAIGQRFVQDFINQEQHSKVDFCSYLLAVLIALAISPPPLRSFRVCGTLDLGLKTLH